MTKDEAKQILQMLMGAFPRHGLDDAGVRMWADALSRWEVETATTAAQRFIQRDDFLPSIAKFASETKRVIDASKLGVAKDDCANPDGCQGWWLDVEEVPVISRATGDVAEVRERTTARPCADCRPDLFQRWKSGELGRVNQA